MNILLITSHLRIGGIPVYVVTLANYLHKRGHRVFVVSGGGELEKEIIAGVENLHLPLDAKSILSPKIWFALPALFRLIRKEKIDIIHAHTRVSQFASWLTSKITGAPYVITWHGFYRPHLFRRIIPCFGNITIAISQSVACYLEEDFGRDKDKVRLVFNGVDVSKFINDYSPEEKKAIKSKYGLGEGPVIGIVSRVSFEKGHTFLLEAFNSLLAEAPGVQLVIVGSGRLKPLLEKRIAELRIKNSVFFFETLKTREFFGIMNIFTRPSIEEPFGLGVVEAMLMGLPVVCTDVGDFRFMLDEGKAGILVSPSDSEGLKRSLLKILTDPVLAKRLGAAARDYAMVNFSADRMVSEIENVYKEAVGNCLPR
ncbi:MAG: glycosyltransferase family 4 protein [Candidatus Omnitrophota bacterium]